MAAEGSPDPRVCILCAGEGSWRCKDCTGKPLLCLHCCREQHQSHPFHRVQHWNGTFFEDAWLYQAGVKLFFGHGGKLCPSKQFLHGKKAGLWEWSGDPEPGNSQDLPMDQLEHADWELGQEPDEEPGQEPDEEPGQEPDEELGQEPDEEPGQEPDAIQDSEDMPEGVVPDMPVPPEAADFTQTEYDPQWKKRLDGDGNPFFIVVDWSGMHPLPGVWCACHQKAPEDWQALDMGLYPATDKSIRTFFTFQCLDDFLADNQECNTSTYHYIEKIRRLTNSSFPSSAPVTLVFFPVHLLLIRTRIDTRN
jgi:hypothetical protein